jgi:hypothetical protein
MCGRGLRFAPSISSQSDATIISATRGDSALPASALSATSFARGRRSFFFCQRILPAPSRVSWRLVSQCHRRASDRALAGPRRRARPEPTASGSHHRSRGRNRHTSSDGTCGSRGSSSLTAGSASLHKGPRRACAVDKRKKSEVMRRYAADRRATAITVREVEEADFSSGKGSTDWLGPDHKECRFEPCPR